MATSREECTPERLHEHSSDNVYGNIIWKDLTGGMEERSGGGFTVEQTEGEKEWFK